MPIVKTKFPRGRTRVGRIRPSTGIYGKRVGGRPNANAVKQRGRG